jgi:hypothetical protein
VDVEEKMYAAGKIPGGFFKREGRAGEKAILTARMVDRPIRPLWPKGYKNEVQVVVTTFSADQVHGHDILAMNGASAALMLSPLPFLGPVGAVRVGRLDGQLMLNPTLVELKDSTLDLVVCGTPEAITMVEAGAEEIDEDTLVEALQMAHDAIKEICRVQISWPSRPGSQVVGRRRHRAPALFAPGRAGPGHPGGRARRAAAQGGRDLREEAPEIPVARPRPTCWSASAAVRDRRARGRGAGRRRLPESEGAVRRRHPRAVRRGAGLEGAEVGEAGGAARGDRAQHRPRLPEPG